MVSFDLAAFQHISILTRSLPPAIAALGKAELRHVSSVTRTKQRHTQKHTAGTSVGDKSCTYTGLVCCARRKLSGQMWSGLVGLGRVVGWFGAGLRVCEFARPRVTDPGRVEAPVSASPLSFLAWFYFYCRRYRN